MEYVQMTLSDWAAMKEGLKQDLIGVQESFVRIGYKLRRIEKEELYKQDGYKSIADFAREEYGLNATTVSRFMAINRKYSVGGYSERLQPEFSDFGSSKLSEMLSLPDADLCMIQPEATRESIRELKQFNREAAPEAGEGEGVSKVIESFYKDNPEILNALYASEAYTTGEIKGLVEIVNPSGNRTYRKGIFFVVMYEEHLKIKKFGEKPEEMAWGDFFAITQEIFREDAAGNKTYENHFGASNTGQKEKPDLSGNTRKKEEKVNKKEEAQKGEEKEEANHLTGGEGTREEIVKAYYRARSEAPKEESRGGMNPPEEKEIAPAQETTKETVAEEKKTESQEVLENPKTRRKQETQDVLEKILEAVGKEDLREAEFYTKILLDKIGQWKKGV